MTTPRAYADGMAFFVRRFAWVLVLPAAAFAVFTACVGNDAAPPADVSCLSYCADIQNQCTGSDVQFPDNATCQRFCATFALKGVGANSVECRLSQLSSQKEATTAAEKHLFCANAGVASASCPSRCEGFCTANLALCGAGTTPNERYADIDSCKAACATLKDATQGGFAGALIGSTGDTVECRTYHLELSQTGKDIDKTTHCPHTTVPNKSRCTDAPPADGGVTDSGAADAGVD